MPESASIKDPAAVDALFRGLAGLHVHPDRLEFAAIVPTDRVLRGGYGEVRQATLHPSSESLQPDGTRSCREEEHITVAVKLLKDLDRASLQHRKRMVVREIHLLSKVVHPNIVPFQGFYADFERSIAWLISEWQPFGNVSDYLRNYDLSVIDRLRLLHDTVTALAYMHSLVPLICHGDIKAANVLVGRERRAMLCDFGLARIIQDEDFQNLETSLDFQGSIPWCSPEVLDGKRASPESDMWAFGCLVWEVATGKSPFADLRGSSAVVSAIVQYRLPQPQQQPCFRCVPGLSKHMKGCWHKDPVARPSAQKSVSILSKIMEDPTVGMSGGPVKGSGSLFSQVFRLSSTRISSEGNAQKERTFPDGQPLPNTSSVTHDSVQPTLVSGRVGSTKERSTSGAAIQHSPSSSISKSDGAHQRQRRVHEQGQQEREHELRQREKHEQDIQELQEQAPKHQQEHRPEDGRALMSSSSSVENISIYMSTTKPPAPPTPPPPGKIRNADGPITFEAVARGSATASQPLKQPTLATSPGSLQPAKGPVGVWGANKASFAEMVKKTGDQPVQPAKRLAQSHSPRRSPAPARASSSPPPRGLVKNRPPPKRPTAKASASAPSKTPELPSIVIHPAPPNDSELSQLSPQAVGEYFVNPVLGTAGTDLLDRYDFTGRLVNLQVTAAFGGLSDVKKGRINGSQTIVAIKVLRMKNMKPITQYIGDPQQLRLRKRLARELRIWLFLRHPRILVLLGFAFIDQEPCLLSPWCKNGNATQYLALNPSANRGTLVVQVVEGLLYLHSRDPAVVHANLNPLNILLNDDGDAVICDFGISKLSGEAKTSLTTSEGAFMSLRYAGPEILLNKEPTTKSDVYGFGCVALELFTDRYPQFGVNSTAHLINHVTNGPMSDPAQYPNLPDTSPLWGLFRRCWATKLEERPTMQEVYDKLMLIQSK